MTVDTESAGVSAREFDGVICFGGEDWWYHNRGHYDMQMMRELSNRVPVLYVNSIGMRVPRVSEGRMFLTRVRRKLKSLRQGLVEAQPSFWVFSPFAIPGRRGLKLNKRFLPLQVRRAAQRIGIRKPLIWVACPPACAVLEPINGVGLVYQRTDRFEEFSGVDADQIRSYDRQLKSRADLTVFCAMHLYERESGQCRAAIYADHGVDFDRFAEAGRRADDDLASIEPADVQSIARPRVGFVGGIDTHTFDPILFISVAEQLPHCQFVMVGACSLPEGWADLPNVHLLGQRPYEDVADYMASCDVLIMPWNENEWIEACNPVKLKEYLAVGRPIVTRPFDELRNYQRFVHVARSSEAFAAAIVALLNSPSDPERLRSRVTGETWSRKTNTLIDRLALLGLHPARLFGAATTSGHADTLACGTYHHD